RGIPLWDLAIPGSHDSMSYCLDTHSPVLGSESFVLQLLDWLAPCILRPCVYRWATTGRLHTPNTRLFSCPCGDQTIDSH
uniref:Phosphatidylinositol-specific phospholipase C X domain-containing protein n=1 Tax=Hucho hucho TaxID=62062 RepID=A0A4W5J826_9TELE